jgi:hypothetical protein
MSKNIKAITVNANPILDIENNDDVKQDVKEDVKEEASNDIDTVVQDMPITKKPKREPREKKPKKSMIVVDLRNDEEKQLDNDLSAVVEEVKPLDKPKRGRKKKVIPEFKIIKASEGDPIVVKFE